MAAKRDLLLIGGGRVATALIALVAIRAATTFLTPEQYGSLALLIAVQMFCGLFLVNPVGQHINRHTHQWWDDGSLISRLSQYRYYVFGVSLLGGVSALFMIKGDSFDEIIGTAVALLLMVIAATWNATSIPMLNMLGFRAESVFWAVFTALAGLLASVGLVVWFPTAIAWFSGQVAGMALGAIGAGYVLRRHVIRSGHEAPASPVSLLDRKTITAYCIPLAVATGFMWLQLSGYRFVVEAYWGLEQLGFLAVGLALAGQVWALTESLVTQFLYPMFFRRITHADRHDAEQALSDLLNVLGPVYLVLTGVTVIGAPFLVWILVDEKYSGAAVFVMLGAAIECCRVLGNVFGNAAQVTRKTRSLTLPYAVGAIMVFVLVFLAGTNQTNIVWVGVSLVAGAIAMFMMMLLSMYREVRFSLEAKRWILGGGAMSVLVAAAFWLKPQEGWVAAFLSLGVIAMVGGLLVAGLLWSNPALHRLLAVKLHKGPRTRDV